MIFFPKGFLWNLNSTHLGFSLKSPELLGFLLKSPGIKLVQAEFQREWFWASLVFWLLGVLTPGYATGER